MDLSSYASRRPLATYLALPRTSKQDVELFISCNMDEYNRSDVSALLTSAIMIAANFGINLDPEQLRFFSTCAPVLNRCINRVLGLFEPKSLSKIECARLGICYASMVESVRKNLDNNCRIILPEFTQPNETFSKAEEIVEAIFKSAVDDSQTIKSKLYGSLLGNIPFQNRYDSSKSYLLLNTVMQLSYDELCLLSVLKDIPATNYTPIELSSNSSVIEATTLFAELIHIKNLGLLKSVRPYTVGCSLGNLQISSLGQDLCNLLNLSLLGIEDIDLKRKQVFSFISKEPKTRMGW